jgi:NAD(P)-dependent dehydrogenase (short-subunit alcohol dehydrogenase family)
LAKQPQPSIDILVNCAGQTQRKILFRTEDPEITEILESNLRSAILGCRVVGRQMLRPTPGSNSDQAPFSKCIINVSSLLAHRAVQGTAVYAATKAGMLGLTASLANELGRRGIRVNAIVPGYIETAMTKGESGTAIGHACHRCASGIGLSRFRATGIQCVHSMSYYLFYAP